MSHGLYSEVPSEDAPSGGRTDQQPPFWSRLTFRWAFKGVNDANREKPLEEFDFGPAAGQSKARDIVEALRTTWHSDVTDAVAFGRTAKLWKSLFRVTDASSLWVCMVLIMCSRILQPVFLFAVMQSVIWDARDSALWIFCIGAGMWVTFTLEAMVYDYFTYSARTISASVRTAVTGLFYSKILLMKESDLGESLSSNLIEKTSRHLKQLDSFPSLLPYLVIGPLEFVLYSVLLCLLLEWTAITGLIYLLICAMLRCGVGRVLLKLRGLTVFFTLKRLSLFDDVILGIRAIKMYTWENLFARYVSDVRSRELQMMSRKAWILAGLMSVQDALPVVSLLVSMVTVLLTNHTLTPEIVFTTFLILTILKTSCVQHLPSAVESLLHTLNTLSDIEAFLLSVPESAPSTTRRGATNQWAQSMTIIQAGYLEEASRVEDRGEHTLVTQASAEQPQRPEVPDESPPAYTEIDELPSRVSSQAPARNPSRRRSLSVFDVSCEQTFLPVSRQFTGLTNVTLSCVEGEILAITGRSGAGKSALLESIAGELPLSRGRVYLSGKIAYVTQTPWLFKGTLKENILFGEPFNARKYAEVVEVCALAQDFDEFVLGDMSVVGAPGVSLSAGQQARLSLARAVYSDAEIYLLDEPLALVGRHIAEYIFTRCIMGKLSRRTCVIVTKCQNYLEKMSRILLLVDGVLVKDCDYRGLIDSGEDLSWLHNEGSVVESAALSEKTIFNIAEEKSDPDQSDVRVTWQVYRQYLAAGAHWLVLLLLGVPVLLLPEATMSFLVFWVARMSTRWYETQHQVSSVIMSTALVGTILLALFLRVLFFLDVGLNSSKDLHSRSVSVVLRASVDSVDEKASSLFRTFSKDMETVDETIPLAFVQMLCSMTSSLLAALVVIIVAPFTVVAVLPTVILLLCIANHSYPVVRELRRLETMASKDVNGHFVETCLGLSNIRSYEKQDFVWNRLYRYQDQHNLAFLTRCGVEQWIAIRCQATVSIVILFVIIIDLLSVDEASLALSFPFVRELVVGIALVPLSLTLLEKHMSSVAEILKLLELPAEPGYSSSNVPPASWPESGGLEFENISFKYPGGGDAVLKNFSLDIAAGMKIACIGRTGAGKSSLVAALFRLAEPKGHIFIDGISLKDLNLQAARAAMFVATRHTFLFTESLRRNLDPHQRFSDRDLWGVLEVVRMKAAVEDLPGQLSYVITNQGRIFEPYERQLLGLARALLQDKKIIILDSVDLTNHFKTTRIVETMLKSKFQDRTVISLVHGNVGLDTILCQDMVAVLEGGRLTEFDSPQNLLCKEDSYLVSLWKHYRSAPPLERKVRFGRASVSN